MATLEAVSSSDFDQKVIQADGPTLVDFWAEWCGPCKALTPVLEEIAEEMGDKARIVKVNVDENRELAQKYGIRGIPTLILFNKGQAAKTLVGNQPKEEIVKTLSDA